MRAVISVTGEDKVGILAKVSGECANADVNVVDVTQTILGNKFVMVMNVEIKGDVVEFRKHLEEYGKNNSLDIHVKNEEIFNAMHRI
ncbi:MAG: ACT domain-containing protein [Erysipelotrichaceae bacterium]